MRIVSWNVNGLRACYTKGFYNSMLALNADMICLQETKLTHKSYCELNPIIPGYASLFSHAEKAGYSGTGIFTRIRPFPDYFLFDEYEGRVCGFEYDNFILVTAYVPNSKRDLSRIDYRMEWDAKFRSFLKNLHNKKPVILCGDLNVCHNEIDLKNDKSNHFSAGFTDQERKSFEELLALGFTDAFRFKHPNDEVYSFWQYLGNARERNVGWRLDYFLADNRLKESIKDSFVKTDIYGSDHCPIVLDIDLH